MNLSRLGENISIGSMACINLRCSLRILWTVATTLVFLTRSSAASVIGETDKAIMYLAQYGYLSPSVRNPSGGHLMDESSWRRAISEFQSFAGLNVTGELDEETKKVMSLPRFGVRDKVDFGKSRAKRYALLGYKWPIKNLTYTITKYPANLYDGRVDDEIAKAFSVWSNYTDLIFTHQRSGPVNIEISFEQGDHGDGDPFDGPGRVLGHAYISGFFIGKVHFDYSELWTIDSWLGLNLLQVAAHEFGHVLGLDHSNVDSALMAPMYRPYDPALQLDQDDVQGIQALYGPKTQLDIATSNEAVAEDPAFCSDFDAKFDTIFKSADGATFVFKGEHYWKLTENGVAAGYPLLISRDWLGLPGNIDAAFNKNGKTYFFKGSKYWRYSGQKMDGDYPKEISEGFPGIPDNIDAALVWSGNGKIYFYKGSKFWRFDPAQRPPVKSSYPKPLSNWVGIPNNIDAALRTNNSTYFFKSGLYWRFNDTTFSVDSAYPAYPRTTGYWWLGCRSAPNGNIIVSQCEWTAINLIKCSTL